MTDITNQILVLPSTENSRGIGSDDRSRERREMAIEFGIIEFGKSQLKKWKGTSRRVQEKVFATEFSILDDMLHQVSTGYDKDSLTRFAINKSKYVELIRLLTKRRNALKEIFNSKGLGESFLYPGGIHCGEAGQLSNTFLASSR